MVPCWICIIFTLPKTLSPNRKKTLSIVFSVERFHEYLYGCKFAVINDHQPLKPVFNKPTGICPLCIQKFCLHLQKYGFDLKYFLGKAVLVSDAFSWEYIKNPKEEFD